MKDDTFPYSEKIASTHRVMVPVRTDASGAQVTVLRERFLDVIAWPKDTMTSKGTFVPRLVEKARREGRIIPQIPISARNKWGSVMVQPFEFGGPSNTTTRKAIDKLFDGRTLVIYADKSVESPIRVAIVPPILDGEVGEAIRSSGWKSKKTGNGIFLGSFSLLTRTSKMGCFSFNLPAGPPSMNGTCPSSDLAFLLHTPEQMMKRASKRVEGDDQLIDPASFICNGCYALKGRYPTETIMTMMHARLLLVKSLLGASTGVRVVEVDDDASIALMRKRPGASRPTAPYEMAEEAIRRGLVRHKPELKDVLVRAIKRAQLLLRKKLKNIPEFRFTVIEYLEEQLFSELWRERREEMGRAQKRANKLRGDAANEERKRVKALEEQSKRIVAVRPKKSWQFPDPAYFRIHDAGDYFRPDYLEAWIDVARKLRDVHFWSPTRAWAVKSLMPEDLLRRIPENMVVRPSSLHFRQRPPDVSSIPSLRIRGARGGGLAAGSGSSADTKLPRGSWSCPAYVHWSVGGGALVKSAKDTDEGPGGTCTLARGPRSSKGCRACWDNPEMEIYYYEH